jgi:hypothetical protein
MAPRPADPQWWAGVAISGYNPATTRVNEPGRFIWVKLNVALN